jgi:glycosyltransferase involved in cell wall biosynthesis
VRTLQDFGLDDVVTASRLAEDFNAAYPIPLKVQHYQWRKGADAGFERRGREYEACNLNEQKNAVAGVTEIAGQDWRGGISVGVPGHRVPQGGRRRAVDRCGRRRRWGWVARTEREGFFREGGLFREKDVVPAPVPIVHDKPVGNGGAPGGYPGERRVVIFASVWTHVDGVSRTMKRLAHHLGARSDSSVFVMSPDLAERDFTEAANNDRYHVADVPHVPMPGRGEYKMAAPLQARQRHQMETFAPHVVHVAAPDMLGHSALRWAAENGVCSVCSYHTAYDTYLQYYRVGVLATPLRQMLGGFYSSCDVVATPSYAAAEHLSDMGVPRERMGFFPRGINLTMYSPAQRSLEFRRDVMGVGSKSTGARPRRAGKERGGGTGKQSLADAGTEDGEVVILWVARIVREKGLGSFAKTVTELLTAKREGSIEGLPPFRVVVAGDGPDLPWLRRQIEHFPEVKILGHTGGDRLSRTYAAGDVFFFPSRTEVIPNNLIESMASGLAVVTDDVGVNRAIVKDGVTGVLVGGTEALPGDVTAYVDALVTLLRDPERRRRMGKAARKSTHGLTWERTFGSLRRSYDRCRPGRPYARHLDPNVPGSKAATDLAARDAAYGDATTDGGVTVRSGGGVVQAHGGGANSHEEHGVSVSGALLGISAAAAGGGGGGVASALAAASSALWHPTHHEHAAGHATATLHAVHEQRIDSHLEDSSSSSSSSGGGGGSSSSSTSKLRADSGDPRYVPGSGPGDVNVGGVRERDVIVDPGAPPGSLLYRLSYGMTGGYVRSIEDAREDDEAIAAAEAAAAEAAARALSIGTWGGGGLMGAGGGFFANSRVAKTTKA